MLDDDATSTTETTSESSETSPPRRTRRRAASRPAGPPAVEEHADAATSTPPVAEKADADQPKKAKKTTSRKKAATKAVKDEPSASDTAAIAAATDDAAGTAEKPKRKRAAKTTKAAKSGGDGAEQTDAAGGSPVALLFQAPDPVTTSVAAVADTEVTSEDADDADGEPAGNRRRRSRGGRNRRKPGGATDSDSEDATGAKEQASGDESAEPDEASGSSRRRRRRRRSGEDSGDGGDDPASTVTKVRSPRAKKETITSVEGSTRIEAKKQRRREGREAGRRRPPILSESEFLARRESVERVMAIRQRGETTQIAVLEDNVLVEHYVALESQTSIIGNVYLGRVQNVLPSMEAAFIDIGKGRNAVLYAGEVNWDLIGDANAPRRIENALKPGQSVLVQVSKDPVGHKGARLTSQINLPGRYLVYVPGGGTSGISRKLPDTERNRLKSVLKEILPDNAGVIIRTAAEGASEDELTRDVTRLTARWDDIEKKSKNGQAPALLYAEPDTTLKVVRDLFTEDFSKLVISGDDAWDMVDGYVQHVAPDLGDRLSRYDGDGDVFSDYRIDEQINKALDRKVWLPSGGSLIIDRTEAMTVVDVNTGKFTGSGGNLEETVTKNNLEAAEEIVRQLRLRDIGGIIVIDFIDMVLENNRDLVLRRLVECLGRDRTRHQVAEVTSLGLVQMTRKRISTGLLEAFSHTCDACQGRGVTVEAEPIEPKKSDHNHGAKSDSNGSRSGKRSSNRRRGRRSGGGSGEDADAKSSNGDESSDKAAPPAAGSNGSGDGSGKASKAAKGDAKANDALATADA